MYNDGLFLRSTFSGGSKTNDFVHYKVDPNHEEEHEAREDVWVYNEDEDEWEMVPDQGRFKIKQRYRF